MIYLISLLACSSEIESKSASNGVNTETDASSDTDPLEWSVLDAGLFTVGYRQIEYPSSVGDYQIPVNIWYPATSESGETVIYSGLFPDEKSFVDAQLAESVYTVGFPVMVFSHGKFLYGGSSSYLMRHFASHGWVVVAPDHVGNLMTDYSTTVPLHIYQQRPNNTQDSLDALFQDSFFADKLQTDKVIQAGFSFGSYDTWASIGAQYNVEGIEEACGQEDSWDCSPDVLAGFTAGYKDERIIAAIPMAGAKDFDFISALSRGEVTIPTLQISGTLDDDAPADVYEQSSHMTWLSIEGGCHALFSVGACTEVDTQHGYYIVQAYALAFARQQLFNDSTPEVSSMLDGTLVIADEVSMHLPE